MPFAIRKFISANDVAGKAVVVTEEHLLITAVSRGVGENITGCEMWSTDRTPVDTSVLADAPQLDRSATDPSNPLPTYA